MSVQWGGGQVPLDLAGRGKKWGLYSGCSGVMGSLGKAESLG